MNMHEDEDRLSTVHDAMSDAAASPEPAENDPNMVVQTFRIPQGLKDDVRRICEANGTTLSSWLRECCERLRSDYRPS